ncbi:GerMN domain-containing protein [Nocardioides sp. Y6]|uniref:GerMN domain-containing protein n=1 Tax=Nocardioides malaquae TaxID=2773426 RepID=A0ABR9RQ47_9ACTN|nr:Gmad2 immunoglobulin-like domain-containing protein [Nocardioides malaquae]MBE7323689.1 GerMN domain-containing protein [Nocardioides malaquae]
MISKPSLHRRRRALISACAVAALTLTGCGSEGTPDSAETNESTPDATPTQTDEAQESQEPAPITVAVPLYYAGEAAGELRLFREFQQVEGVALTEAAKLVDGGTPLDPDYRTLWPGDTVTDVKSTDRAITVTLNGDAFTERPDGMSEHEAWLAIQQMVHTLQGVEQAETPVQFVRRAPGAETPESQDPDTSQDPTTSETPDPTGETEAYPSTLFGIDVSAPVKRAKWENALALVNISVPSQDGTVSGDVLDAEGLASSFEATVPWQVLKDEEVVLEGFATAEGWVDKLHPWHTSIDVSELEPGDYTFVAMTDDPTGGAEGPGPTSDSKEFTLQ